MHLNGIFVALLFFQLYGNFSLGALFFWEVLSHFEAGTAKRKTWVRSSFPTFPKWTCCKQRLLVPHCLDTHVPSRVGTKPCRVVGASSGGQPLAQAQSRASSAWWETSLYIDDMKIFLVQMRFSVSAAPQSPAPKLPIPHHLSRPFLLPSSDFGGSPAH